MNAEKGVLLILDGMGIAPEQGRAASATTAEHMPYVHGLMQRHGHALLQASGSAIGLDEGVAGNSEVGHLTIGSGEVLQSTLARVREGYHSGAWLQSPVWQRLAQKQAVHVVGLLSDAGVHAHWQTLSMAAQVARQAGFAKVYLHLLLDGVDSQAGSAPAILDELRAALESLQDSSVVLSSVMGRKWGMDRSGNWALTDECCRALMDAGRDNVFSPDALRDHLAGDSEASFPPAYCAGGQSIAAGDTVLLTLHRADRISQLAKRLNEHCRVLSLIELKQDAVPVDDVFFPTRAYDNGLVRQLKRLGYRTTRLAEQCKFPHVTYFMDGMSPDSEAETIMIPTISDDEIRLNPLMSIQQMTDTLETLLASRDGSHALIVNIPNLDQVGHTGDLELTARAARCVDELVSKVVTWCELHQWQLAITADHGNADHMRDENGKALGSHSANPVPLLLIDRHKPADWAAHQGTLANVAASFLGLLGHTAPSHFEPALIAIA